MNKNRPSWQDVALLYSWLAMDPTGSWYAYEYEPIYVDDEQGWDVDSDNAGLFAKMYNGQSPIQLAVESKSSLSSRHSSIKKVEEVREYCPVCDGRGGFSGPCLKCGF